MYAVQEDDGEGDDEVEVVGVEVEAEEGWGGQEEGEVSRQEALVLAGALIPQPMVGGVEEAENAAALAEAEAEAANPNPNPVTLALALALTLTLTLTLTRRRPPRCSATASGRESRVTLGSGAR